MRSRLEARFARYLDDAGVEWTYEPCAFSGPGGDYLPDFHLTDLGTGSVYVEVKPRWDHDQTVERAMERMEIIWASHPDAELMVVFGNTDVILRTKGVRWEVDEAGLPGWGTARVAGFA